MPMMTSKERLRAAMVGQPVDRPPIWLREGFDSTPLPARAGKPLRGWQADPVYRDLVEFARPHCSTIVAWSPGRHFNRRLAVAPRHLHNKTTTQADGTQITESWIETPGGRLTEVSRRSPDVNTSWKLKPLATTCQELEALLALPYELEPVNLSGYHAAREKAGDMGLPQLGISSPCVVISGCLHLEDFLLLAGTEQSFMRECLEVITSRFLATIDAIFAQGPLDTIGWMGGAEQCTPPLMRPESYDEYVAPYDGQIVAALKKHGVQALQCHCHGKVRHALSCMTAIGFSATDPVEPPPAGDVTIAEARAIVGDRMTLMGNFEFDELERSEPEHIRRRTREILSEAGPRRLVLAASAGPISRMTPRLAANYRAWIETALEMSAKG